MSPGVVRQMRMAHDSIDDQEFEKIVQQAKADSESLTWKTLVDISHKKCQEEAREESVDRKVIS